MDVTELDLPFYRAGGGIVSTAGEVATMLQAVLGGEFLPDHLRAQMLVAVDSDWEETDRYGLGIGEITALMGRSDRRAARVGPYRLLARLHDHGPLQRGRPAPGRDLGERIDRHRGGRDRLLGHRGPPCLAALLHVRLPG